MGSCFVPLEVVCDSYGSYTQGCNYSLSLSQMLCLSYVSLEPLIFVSQAVPGLLGDPEPLDY